MNNVCCAGMMRKGRIIILSGPSGAGKTSIHERLLKSKALKGKVIRSVSMTTRSPRQGEKNGVDYWFVSKKMFAYKRRAGHFLESEQVFDEYYGTPGWQVRTALKTGKSVLLCIDVQGAKTVLAKCSEAISVFVKAPSLKELTLRLKKRATEKEKDLRKRLDRVRKELREADRYDLIVVNTSLPQACCEVEQFLIKALKTKRF